MPEMVEVSMLSSRTAPDSNSSCQTCFGSLARTFKSTQLSVRTALEDLFRGPIGRAVLDQPCRQPGIVLQRPPRTVAGQLRRDLRRLVPQPPLAQLLGP